MSSHEALTEFAKEHGVSPSARWERVEVTVPAPVDLQRVRAIVAGDGYSATALFGPSLLQLRLSDEPPAAEEIDALRPLAAPASAVRSLETAGSGWSAAQALLPSLAEVELVHRQPNWCISKDVFASEIEHRWVSVGESMAAGTVRIGESSFDVSALPGTRIPILVPPPSIPGEVASIELERLAQLADAQAWRNVATEEVVSGESVVVALHGDQQPVVALAPATAHGGVQLWRWLTRSDDGNREEAVRYVLRLLTASGPPSLPDGAAVATLAERHRIALSRDHAAEVERAIASGRERTANRLEAARGGLASYIEDTTKTAQATLVAALGVVAIALQRSELVPTWLLWTTTLVASLGVAVLVLGRWNRIRDLTRAVENLAADLGKERDPLLPDEERQVLLQLVQDFNATSERRRARAAVCLAGLVSVAVMVAATWWLGVRDTSEDPFADVVAVSGYLRSEDGVTVVCEQLEGADPPACDRRIVVLEGVSSAALTSMRQNDGVTWSPHTVVVTGTRDGDVLRVTSLMP